MAGWARNAASLLSIREMSALRSTPRTSATPWLALFAVVVPSRSIGPPGDSRSAGRSFVRRDESPERAQQVHEWPIAREQAPHGGELLGVGHAQASQGSLSSDPDHLAEPGEQLAHGLPVHARALAKPGALEHLLGRERRGKIVGIPLQPLPGGLVEDRLSPRPPGAGRQADPTNPFVLRSGLDNPLRGDLVGAPLGARGRVHQVEQDLVG